MGCFIVVSLGRPWMLTQQEATANPSRVVLRGDVPVVLDEPGLPYRVTVVPRRLDVGPPSG